MKKKVIKKYSELFKREFTYIIDPKLNELTGSILAPKKLEQANEDLKKMKSLPK